MRRWLLRLVWMVPVLGAVSFGTFVLIRMAPGGPFDRERVPASPEIERALRARYHLDEPLWRQYGRYMGGVLRGDFGPSLKYRSHTVNDLLGQGLPVSLTLGALSFGFAAGVGMGLGVAGAVRRRRWDGGVANLVAIGLVCVPALILGPVLVLVLGLWAGWFPVGLWAGPWHAVLPTLALGLFFAGRIARLMREGLLTALDAPHVAAARAKGLSEGAVLVRHALPLGVLPVVSYLGPLLADLLTGSFVVENLFQIPGIGVFLVNSTLNRDYPVLLGLVLLYAALLLALNFAVDLIHGWLDPRIRDGN